MKGHRFLLEGLRCASCGTEDTLWLDLAAGLAECSECSQRAHTYIDEGGEL